jgi:hypothetical protein
LIIDNYSGDGIKLDVGGNEIFDCFLGTNANGTAAQGNEVGVEVASGSDDNFIGNVPIDRNIISGNATNGIVIESGASGNLVMGNYIGTNAAGTAALANGEGVGVGCSNNTIGGITSSLRNVISGNAGDGIDLTSVGSANQVLGNYVGLNANGSPLGNGTNGIEVGGTGNTLGGTTSGALNNIEENGGDGIVFDVGASSNLVIGNKIESNTLNGVEIAGNSNTLGGTTAAARNYISLNGKDGLLIDSGATQNIDFDDFIGAARSGTTAAPNGGNGVEIAGDNNQVGTYVGAHGLISGNAEDGVLIDSGATGNIVLGSSIGTNLAGTAALANGTNGVEVLGNGNYIGINIGGGRNIISGNANDGILLDSSASGNFVLNNYVGTNPTG